MKRRVKRSEILERLGEIAFGKANDIVKLAFLDPKEEAGLLDGLDLTMLSEVKRAANGAVEVKLVNRIEVMQLLLAELKPVRREKPSGGAEMFFRAMDEAAQTGGSAE